MHGQCLGCFARKHVACSEERESEWSENALLAGLIRLHHPRNTHVREEQQNQNSAIARHYCQGPMTPQHGVKNILGGVGVQQSILHDSILTHDLHEILRQHLPKIFGLLFVFTISIHAGEEDGHRPDPNLVLAAAPQRHSASAGSGVPHLGGSVMAARHDARPVRRDGHGRDRVPVSLERPLALASVGVPHLGGVVIAARHDARPVWGERHGRN